MDIRAEMGAFCVVFCSVRTWQQAASLHKNCTANLKEYSISQKQLILNKEGKTRQTNDD
jgi:hypothetical protein